MDFLSLVKTRQSCRSYDSGRPVEEDKLETVLEAGRLAPSACNGQPYRISVCTGAMAKNVAKAVQGMGMNRFAAEAPVMLVISEEPYVKSAAVGAKIKKNDYRSMDIGILAAHLSLAAESVGLASCILGWLDDKKLRALLGLSEPVRLVLSLGYAKKDDPLREKKRKSRESLCRFFSDEA